MRRALPHLVGALLLAALAWAPVRAALLAPWWERLVDLRVYREAGQSLLAGEPLYEHLTPVPDLLPFTYPPVAALGALPLALLPAGVVDVAWTLGQVALLVLVVHLAWAPLLARAGRWRPAALGALAGAACRLQPVEDGLAFGQVGVLLVALCLADHRRRRPGALVGAATALKLTPGVFLVHLWVAGRRRAALTALATAAALTVLAALALPEASWDYWTRALLDSDRLGANAGTSNQALRGVLLRLGPGGAAGTALWLAAVAAVAWYGFRAAARAARAGDEVRAVALVGLLSVLLSPVAWIHHLAWVVVALGALAGDGRSWRRVAAAAAAAALFALPLPWTGVAVLVGDGPQWWGRLLQQAYCLGALALLVVLGQRGRDRRRLRARRPLPAP
ncbi:glycosyltransferase 87 family protein [Vallicoccus soli]|uniref:glycosyltransferase 87 family protein n=1 Tax=Vallicoccus soli TaxID=2339232 RepID=UPI001C49832F|nr:glycosyltransferase 87 family protein [Vallicoccus soli]